MAASPYAILFVPGVTLLICFLAYSSQYLFLYIEPAPLDQSEQINFNLLLVGLWICYFRNVTIEPGQVPSNWKPKQTKVVEKKTENNTPIIANRPRWCRKCQAFKAPRSHHCKTCEKYEHLTSLNCVRLTETDAYQKWTTTVPGLPIASLTSHSLISSDSICTLARP